jgi:uncharacterized protein (DUF2267 family)
MSEHGLAGIDGAAHKTYVWLDEIAAAFHGDRHHALQILRAFLHLLRDHLSVDESAQLAAQFPVLVRGLYFEGWDPSHSLIHERSSDAFLARFVHDSGIRQMDARDAVAAAWTVLRNHVTAGEVDDVFASLPAHLRELLSRNSP